jgi:hypothetical protein
MAMTEATWLSCKAPRRLLDFLGDQASPRKLRLFACACCRRTLFIFPNPEEKDEEQAVLILAERFADGLASAEELADAEFCKHDEGATWIVADSDALQAARDYTLADRKDCRQGDKAALLRDIFGNPFCAVKLGPAWRTATVEALAQAVYEERILPDGNLDPTRLAILADALEEAGCAKESILAHLRGPGPHVRGCWAVDLLLARS